MELKQLQAFMAVVEEGTISAAAKRLHMAQPPLSCQMKSLEEELGTPLFWRGARHITLTPAGQALYKRAQQMQRLSETAKQEVAALRGKVQGTLRIGTVSSSFARLLPYVRAFHAQYPEIRFELEEGNTYELLDLLRRDLIEIAVVRTPFPMDGMQCRFLEAEPMAAAARPGWFAGEGALSVAALASWPLIVYRRFENLIASVCQEAGFEPDLFYKTQDARTSLLWADAGLGVALVPQSALAIIPGGLSFRPIAEESLYTRIAAIAKQTRTLSEPAEAFLAAFGACS